MSIRYKIALLFSAFFLVLITMIGLVIYFYSAQERLDTFRNRLKNRALSTARFYSALDDTSFSLVRKMDASAVSSLYNKGITIVNHEHSHEYMYADAAADSLYISDEIIEKAKAHTEYYFNYKDKKAVAIHQHENNKNFVVAVAAMDEEGMEFLGQLKKIIWIAVAVAAALSFFAGMIFAKSLINPLARITGEVNLISSNNLSQRIKISNAKDELTKLAQTFNNLLDRLQDSFAVQRRFISNASHELSTPLTSISSQIEVAMQKNRAPEEYREVIKSVQEDILDLQQLTRSLLDIAKTGTQGSIDLTEVRIDELLFKIASDVQKQHENFKVSVRFEMFPENEKMLSAFGNSDLLYIALKNIIDNGCKYSYDHESIITASFKENNMLIKVFNQGDVIAESDIQNIFQPFFRAGSVQQKPGFGLGLTLSRGILSLHRGEISVQSDLIKGTVFTVMLPNVLSAKSV